MGKTIDSISNRIDWIELRKKQTGQCKANANHPKIREMARVSITSGPFRDANKPETRSAILALVSAQYNELLIRL